MSQIEVREAPECRCDPGMGVRIDPRPGVVEIGMTWDGAERHVVSVPADVLQVIVDESMGLAGDA